MLERVNRQFKGSNIEGWLSPDSHLLQCATPHSMEKNLQLVMGNQIKMHFGKYWI